MRDSAANLIWPNTSVTGEDEVPKIVLKQKAPRDDMVDGGREIFAERHLAIKTLQARLLAKDL